MVEKPDASTTLGIELEKGVLKAVQLSYKKKGPTFDKFFEFIYDPENVNPLYIKENDHELFKSLQKNLVISALNPQETLIRQLEIQLKKEKDIEEVLAFQTEPLLPYPAENAILDYLKIDKTDEGSLLTVLVARKDHIQAHLDNLSHLNIEPEIVSSTQTALINFANTCCPSAPQICMINIGMYQSTCIFIQNSKLYAAQAIPKGLEFLIDALKEEPSSTNIDAIDFNQLSSENYPFLFQAWENLRLEIKRIIFSFNKQSKNQEIKNVLITGPVALIPNLSVNLVQNLGMTQVFPEPTIFQELDMDQKLNLAIPIGAALSGLPTSTDKINFRQAEYTYPYPWKRLKNTLIIFSSLCLALGLAFYLFGAAYLTYREDQIKNSYLELLTTMNKSFGDFEEHYSSTKNSISLGIDQLNEEDLNERVQALEKDLQSTPNVFPLLPNVPRVSDVLAWLSSQNMVVGKNSPESLPQQPLQIESFNYSLVKRPEKNKPQEKYQVKIEMEFTSQTPKQAREFHDALIEPNDFVDPKGEVKWNTSHGRYRTSFYLKDKTIYPSGL